MPANELTVMSIADAGERIRRRALSPVELTRAYLSRIRAEDGAGRCFITVLHDEALVAAAKAEQEIVGGRYRGPLHGIPMALKDLVMTRGIRTMRVADIEGLGSAGRRNRCGAVSCVGRDPAR